jgi:hypothetical protein
MECASKVLEVHFSTQLNRELSDVCVVWQLQNASAEDVNRSWLGRTAGGIVLVALAR